MPTMLGLTSGSDNRMAESKKPKSEGEPKKKGRLDTISKRNHADALNMETLLWRALCDEPESAEEYIADDCVMLNPVSFGTDDILEGKEDIVDALRESDRYAGFKMQDGKQVSEVGLMAVSVLYRVALFKQTEKGPEQVDAMVSSVWRQTAGADWFLVSQLVAFAD